MTNSVYDRFKTLTFLCLSGLFTASCGDGQDKGAIDTNAMEETTAHHAELPSAQKPEIEEIHEVDVSDNVHLQFDSQALANKIREYMKIASYGMARHGGMVVPRDLRNEAFILGQTTGVPPALFVQFAYAESHFNCDSENPSSSAGGCYHLLRDTIYEKIRDKKGTAWEGVFPLSRWIDQNSEYEDGRKRFRIVNPDTGKEDNALTKKHYLTVRRNSFLEGVLKADVDHDNARILTQANQKITGVNLYAQWFFGPFTGRNFAKLRETKPNAPILNIYSSDREEAIDRGEHSILNIGNRNIYFQPEFVMGIDNQIELLRINAKAEGKKFSYADEAKAFKQIVMSKIQFGELQDSDFKSVSEVASYLKNVKKLSDEEYEFFEPNEEIIKAIHIDGKSLEEHTPEPEEDEPEDEWGVEAYQLARKEAGLEPI